MYYNSKSGDTRSPQKAAAGDGRLSDDRRTSTTLIVIMKLVVMILVMILVIIIMLVIMMILVLLLLGPIDAPPRSREGEVHEPSEPARAGKLSSKVVFEIQGLSEIIVGEIIDKLSKAGPGVCWFQV